MRARESLPKAGHALQEVCVCVSVLECVEGECWGGLVVKQSQNSFFFLRFAFAVAVAVFL